MRCPGASAAACERGCDELDGGELGHDGSGGYRRGKKGETEGKAHGGPVLA
jgi:hypothetical protein